jgi:predicted ATPase
MLKRLYADNYKALVNFEFKPGQLSLLLGANGSGKSTVFNLLGAISDLLIRGQTVAELFALTTNRSDRRDTQYFEIDVALEEGQYRYALEVQHPAKLTTPPFIRTESVHIDGALLYRFSAGEVQLFDAEGSPSAPFPFKADRSFLQNLDGSQGRFGRLASLLEFFARLRVVQLNPFAMDEGSRAEQAFLERSGSNFASFFGFVNSELPEVRQRFDEALREALPGFRSFSLYTAGLKKLLRGSFELSGAQVQHLFLELSDGQRCLAALYLACLVEVRAGSLVCFDEPDNFVSSGEIQPWLQLLRDTVEEREGQVMLISHHPEVMDYLAQDEVWLFDRATGPVRVSQYEPDRSPQGQLLKLSQSLPWAV